jgi:Xaa-Pro aminopeptidase
VEPGIYLPAEALGVRIEDDVLLTANGAVVLSKGAPKTVAEIEKLMASRR